ncbi:MAG TPA: phage portal protein, partial [Candidatus Ozemobacteraceae bacterium]|nr:phage portal protein [Candidatus Ozemobacteraceae bacterium]
MLERIMRKLGYQRIGKRSVSGFSAARADRLVASWSPANLTIDEMLRAQLPRIRARSRDLSINNPYVKKFIGMVCINVLGPNGISYQSKVRKADWSMDEKLNIAVEAAWKEWGFRRNSPDVTGKHSWASLQEICMRTVARDGEVFVRLVNGFDNKHRFALQLIEPDAVSEDLNSELPGGYRIVMGVEINPWGRPVAYHVTRRGTNDYSEWRAYQTRERIPAEEMIHLFSPWRINQRRGVPWAYAVMSKTNVLDGYEEAELVASRIAAAKMGCIETADGIFRGDDQDADGRQYIEAEPGAFPILPSGTRMNMFDPQHPTTAYRDFVKQVLRSIACGLEVSYNSLGADLESVNYSSIRAGTLEERDAWKTIQGWLIDDLCRPVFEAWLRMQLIQKTINYPLADMGIICDSSVWRGRSWSWVDPLKDGKANTESLASGMATRTDLL